MLYWFLDGLRAFNSYSWANAEIVRTGVQTLLNAGLCSFLDIQVLDETLIASLEQLRNDPTAPQYGSAGVYSWDHLRLNLEDAIEDSGVFLFWLSQRSASSKWALAELRHAEKNGIPLVFLSLDSSPMPFGHRPRPTMRWQDVSQSPERLVMLLDSLWHAARAAIELVAAKSHLERNRSELSAEIERREAASINGTGVWMSARINRLLSERFELCRLLNHPPDSEEFRIDNNRVTASMALIGNLIMPREIAGFRTQVWPRYCAKCGGMINYGKVYPALDSWIKEDYRQRLPYVSAAGCRCP